MRRWTFTTLGAVFLVLTVAVVALWVRSRWVADAYTWPTPQGDARSVASYAGGVHFHYVKRSTGGAVPLPPAAWTQEALTGRPRWQDRYGALGTPLELGAGGFGVVSGSSSPTMVLTLNGGSTWQAATSAMTGGGSGTINLNSVSGTVTVGSGARAAGNVSVSAGASTVAGPTTAPTPGNAPVSNLVVGSGVVTTSVTPPRVNLTANAITFTSLAPFGNDHHLAVVVPYWFVTLVVGAVALGMLVAARRAWRAVRRRRAGLCRECGYDLRASTGRCPECGTEIATGAAVA